jgi:hypothetical protein
VPRLDPLGNGAVRRLGAEALVERLAQIKIHNV